MGFIRVRQAEGPAHEFDVSEAAYKRNQSVYEVVDSKPVAVSRPAKHVKARRPVKSVAAAAGKE